MCDPAGIRAQRQEAADKYKPDRVRLLLIAEAPPASDDRYFYFEYVPSNDWLFRGVAEAILGNPPNPAEKGSCLSEFRKMGIFLIDVVPDPILPMMDLNQFVPDLISRCRAIAPERIILIKTTVFDAVYEDLLRAGLPVVNERIPFPSHGQQTKFRERFGKALNQGNA